jgi:hypothetical protein
VRRHRRRPALREPPAHGRFHCPAMKKPTLNRRIGPIDRMYQFGFS